jgi:hypothetical protein
MSLTCHNFEEGVEGDTIRGDASLFHAVQNTQRLAQRRLAVLWYLNHNLALHPNKRDPRKFKRDL